MIKKLRRLLIIATATVGSLCQTTAYASFAREFEQYHRRASSEVLNELDREIDLRIQDEKAEQEKQEGKEPGQVDPSKLDQNSLGTDGGWVVRPEMKIVTTRHSNYFGTRIDAKGETIISYIPSVRAVKNFDAWKYQTNYDLYYQEHKNYEHNNRFEHAWSQSIVRKGPKFSMSVQNELDFAAFPTENDEVKLSDYKANDFGADITYKFSPKTSVTGYYSNQRTIFKRTADDGADSANDTFGVRLTHRLRPRLDGFFDYNYRFSRPPKRPKSEDINAQDFVFGLQGSLSSKLSFDIGAGIQSKEFAANPDGLGAIFRGSLRYEYSPKTSFSFRALRDTVPVGSESSTDPLNQLIGFTATYKFKPGIVFYADQSFRFLQGAAPVTVRDPEHPEITTTKIPESLVLTSTLGTHLYPKRGLTIDLLYGFDREISELQVTDRTNHTVSAEVTQQF